MLLFFILSFFLPCAAAVRGQKLSVPKHSLLNKISSLASKMSAGKKKSESLNF